MKTSTQTQNLSENGEAERNGGPDEMARKHKPATIIRAPKNNEHPYKSVRRATIEDPRLSWEERGLLSFLLVKPDDWEISIPALIKVGGAGKNKIYSMIAHLEELRYLERQEVRERGRFVGVHLLLHEIPLPEIGETVDTPPFPENQEMVEPSPSPDIGETVQPPPLPENRETATRVTPFPEIRYPVNRTHTNKEYSTNNEQSTNNEELGIVGVPPTPPLDSAPPLSGQAWQEYLEALCWICHGHQKTDALTVAQFGALTSEAKRMRADGYSKDDLGDWWKKVWRNGWQWDKGRQRPRPDEVRSSIPILNAAEDDEAAPRGFPVKYSQYTTTLEPRS
jgi:hypothetical protein